MSSFPKCTCIPMARVLWFQSTNLRKWSLQVNSSYRFQKLSMIIAQIQRIYLAIVRIGQSNRRKTVSSEADHPSLPQIRPAHLQVWNPSNKVNIIQTYTQKKHKITRKKICMQAEIHITEIAKRVKNHLQLFMPILSKQRFSKIIRIRFINRFISISIHFPMIKPPSYRFRCHATTPSKFNNKINQSQPMHKKKPQNPQNWFPFTEISQLFLQKIKKQNQIAWKQNKNTNL